MEAQLPDMLRASVEWVVPSGSEPLMHWRLFELRSVLRARGIRVTILPLLARFAHEVAANIDDTRPGGIIPLGRRRIEIRD